MIGAVLIVLVFLLGPIALFFGGAIWSALFGTVLSENADGPAAD